MDWNQLCPVRLRLGLRPVTNRGTDTIPCTLFRLIILLGHMSTPITVRVVAMSDKGGFIAVHDDEYCVFSVADTSEVEIGDRLRGDFHGHSASPFDASNLTRRDSPRIGLEDWASPP